MSESDAYSTSTHEAAPQPSTNGSGPRPKKRDVSAHAIIRLTEKLQLELFHTRAQKAYASFYVRGHWETCRIKSTAFKDGLSSVCFRKEGFVPSQSALTEAINTLAGHALYVGPEKTVHTRLAEHDGALYLDLGSDSWEVVRITAEGWDVVSQAPVKFLRAPDMLGLPHPMDGGNFDVLGPILNLGDDNLSLAVAWLVGALQPRGPFPILIMEGTHGSAKSTAARLLLSLVDPRKARLRSAPCGPRDLAISAENSWCLGFDNLSQVKPWLSDALCRLATGSGFSTRAVYTDDEEAIFEGIRPVLLNGIAIAIDREDLRDRCIFLSLPPIADGRRMTEARVAAKFREIQPYVLGRLLDAIACALRRSLETKKEDLPRMADFTSWVCAAEESLGWPEGSFCDVYSRNRIESNELALEASPLFQPIMQIASNGPWEGTATELMHALWEESPAETGAQLPPTPKELSQALRRLAPNLQQIGCTIEFDRTPGSDSRRIIRIKRSVSNAG